MSRDRMVPIEVPLPRDIYRFWSKVEQTPNCWLWTGTIRLIKGRRVPIFGMQGTNYIATRVAYFIHHNIDPGLLLVCHDCPGQDNPICVRREHLWLGTHTENMQDAGVKGMMGGRIRKLWPEQVKEIRMLWATGQFTQQAIANMFGVTQGNVEHIVNYRSHRRNE